MYVAVYGAFDRYNYGDLLFPLVLERAYNIYRPSYKLEYYGIIESNLSCYGGKPTRSIIELLESENLPEETAVIVAGGQVLGTAWQYAYGCLISKELIPFWDALNSQIPRGFQYSIKPNLSGSNLDLPFTIAPDDFKGKVKIAYNAVGGTNLLSAGFPPHLFLNTANKLSNAAFVSVRDQTSAAYLNSSVGSELVLLVPDSACLVSQFFPRDSLFPRIGSHTSQILQDFASGYIVFQIAKSYLEKQDDLQQVANQLEEVYKKYGFPVVLCPLGTAPFHEDQIPLRKIRDLLKTPAYLMEDISVFDTMCVIANSRAFIGTSLHGAITSMSYAVPNISLSNIKKVNAYADTWALPSLKEAVSLVDIEKALGRALSLPQRQLDEKSSQLLSIYLEGFDRMLDSLDEDHSQYEMRRANVKLHTFSKDHNLREVPSNIRVNTSCEDTDNSVPAINQLSLDQEKNLETIYIKEQLSDALNQSKAIRIQYEELEPYARMLIEKQKSIRYLITRLLKEVISRFLPRNECL